MLYVGSLAGKEEVGKCGDKHEHRASRIPNLPTTRREVGSCGTHVATRTINSQPPTAARRCLGRDHDEGGDGCDDEQVSERSTSCKNGG